ncbi:autotransporter domain-containing protein [Breoghania sp.]|uniref:autotransporter outer membrane beta-barrel domain-containing protein n=1 Tax=Breoghania sp. TaxID=2065378 RepID=UPI002AA6A7A9|nr:autotransporter domain-containing protein [Breoghania sp.]
MTRHRLLLASTALVSVLAFTPALAETNWTGALNNQFNVGDNWDGNFSGGDLVIDGNHAVTTSTATIATDLNSLPGGGGGPRSLVISGGATLTSTLSNYAAIAIGWSAGVTSTMTVTGAGSKLAVKGTNAWTNVGWEVGTIGILTIADGGTFETNNHVSVGKAAGSKGTISVDNANLNVLNSSQLIIGDGGDGTVNLANGSTATLTGHVFVGNGANITGTLNITDGSAATVGGQLIVGVGKNSVGNVTVSGGSTLTASDYLVLGLGTTGNATFSDSGTTATFDGPFYVGYTNVGNFTVEKGASTTVSTTAYIGHAAGTNGTVTVTGAGSSFAAMDNVMLGEAGTGNMTVADGAGATVKGNLSVGAGIYYDDDHDTTSYNTTATGVLMVTGSGSTLTVDGTLYAGDRANGTVTVSRGGVISAGAVVIASETGSSGVINIGAAAGQNATPAGKLLADTVTFGAGTGTLVLNHTDSDYVLSAAVSGAGTIQALSGVTSLTGDYSGYTGDTNVDGGTLLVNTDTFLRSAISIADGGTLGGTGTLASVTLDSGATIAPGDAGMTGTLTISGSDVTFVSGSTLSVQIASDRTSDRLAVTGTSTGGGVTIEDGATLHVSGLSGDPKAGYSLDPSYTVLTATNGITGTFSSVTDDFVYLDASVDQDTNEVRVQLVRNAKTLSSAVSSGHSNGHAAANALDSLGNTSELYNAALWMTGGDQDRAYQELSGDSYPGTSQAIMGATRYSRDIVASRIRSAFGGVASMEMAAIATHGDGTEEAVSSSGGPVLWAKGYGAWSKLDSSVGVTGLQSVSAGVVFGADTEIADAWRAGVFAGYGHTHAQARGIVSENNTDTFQLGLYGGRQFGAMGFRLGASYSYHDVSADRTVTVATLTSDLSADYSAHTAYGFAELGYLFRFNDTKVEPFANQAIVHQNTDGFTETGGSAALSVGSSDQTQGISTLGVRFEQDLSTFFHGPFALTGSLAWQHTFGDVEAETTMRFASGGAAFKVTGAALDRDQAVFSAGFRAQLTDSADVSLSYEGTVAEDSQSHGAQATVAIRF